jgi:PAS domain S-box-containing protein
MKTTTQEKSPEARGRWKVSWLGLGISLGLFASISAYSNIRNEVVAYPGVVLVLGISISALAGGFFSGVFVTSLMTAMMAVSMMFPNLGIMVSSSWERLPVFFAFGVATSATFAALVKRIRRAEAKLARDERAIFRMILENLRDAVVECDWKGIVEVNQSVCAMTGFAREELVGKMLPFPFCVPENVGKMATEVEKVMRGEGKEFEITLRRKSGETFPALVCISHFSGDQGKGNLRTVFTIRDITDIKRVQEKLVASEMRLGEAVDTAQLGIWEWDVTADRVFWNAHAKRLFGIPPDIIEGNYRMFMACVHPDDRTRLEDDRIKHETGDEGVEYQYRVLWPDGTVVLIQGRGHVVRDAKGKMVRISGVCMEHKRG